MTELIRGNPALFKFPRLFLDYASSRLPKELGAPAILSREAIDSARAQAAGGASARKEFWTGVREYDARLGASEVALGNIEALRAGRAVPIITGQQPGLFGGPLYTIYKIMTAVALSEHLRNAHGVKAAPVLWNASDDADFLEVSSASFFTGDLERRKFSISERGHTPGKMVGSISIDSVREAADELWSQFGDEGVGSGAAYVKDVMQRALSHARDWGECFSSLYLSLLGGHGVVVVDAREAAHSAHALPLFSAYLRSAESVEEKVLERLRTIEQLGYEEPVSGRSVESCVFVREGDIRRKPSRDEFPKMLAHAERGDASLLPNVLLGPLLRDRLMAPLAHVLGPSEISYSLVSRIVYSTLGLDQGPVFPRLSLTVLPAALVSLLGREEALVTETVLSFDRRLHDHLEESLSSDVRNNLEAAESEVRSGLERLRKLAVSTGRGAEDVTGSASRKMEFELKRIREEFISTAKKKVLSANPKLRAGGEFLLPNGNLQERGFCALAPLVRAGEAFIADLKELAGVHVADCLEGRIYHYLLVSDAI